MNVHPTIMVATDFSPLAEIGHRAGFRLAKHARARRIHFEHIVQGSTAGVSPPYGFLDPNIARLYREILGAADQRLREIRVPIEGIQVTHHVRPGILGKGLIEASQEVKADWVVVASHGYGAFKRTFLGSAASALVRGAGCPVLVVGEGRDAVFPARRVMAAIDLSAVSESVLAQAFKVAGPGATVQVVSLFEDPLLAAAGMLVTPSDMGPRDFGQVGEEHRALVAELVNRIPHEGVEVSIQVLSPRPIAQALLDLSSAFAPDLICIGTSGHSAWHRLMLGSTATRVLHEAKFPVLVIPNGSVP